VGIGAAACFVNRYRKPTNAALIMHRLSYRLLADLFHAFFSAIASSFRHPVGFLDTNGPYDE